MRILAFNHFFDQDLDALSAALDAGDHVDVLPYQRLHRLARRHFPERAFTAVAPAYGAEMEGHWASYVRRAHEVADWLAGAYRPSVFVTPSDTFFYLRPVIERLGTLGVPTVVVQKETTISPMIMLQHSAAVGRAVPFISDKMTVCSERHRQFWLRAGADAERVVVTGQPRFDVYAGARDGPPAVPPTLLYLSYDDTAYLPSDTGVPFEGDWRRLRRQTEEALARVSEAGSWRVVVKRHPQQQARDDWLGPTVTRADRDADTRNLILASEAVVGFQTTALLEAAAAGRRVVYAAWGELFESVRESLIPFDEYGDVVTRAESVDRLSALLSSGPGGIPRPGPGAPALIEEHLGPIDGNASARVVAVLRAVARQGPAGMRRVGAPAVVRALAKGAASPALVFVGPALRLAGRRSLAQAARRRAAQWRQEASEAARLRSQLRA